MTRSPKKSGCYNAPRELPEAAPLGKIRVLDDHLINRIAAGEVVERPASVVKELVENALDAGARRIWIAVQAGGKHAIRVDDDGSGMDRDDALLALERHATSKLRGPRDLETVATLGFRGEALPSIAAVSRLVLRTAAEEGDGVEVEVRGGRIAGVRPVALPRGTSVSAASLFFNVPARRKFLRSEATELSHVARYVVRCALAHPEVAFRLDEGTRTVLDAPAEGGSEARLARVLGEVAARLVPFRAQRFGMEAHGWAGRPAEAETGRGAQHLFVNGRVVQDRVLLHAVAEAYRNTMERERHAPVVLFLTVPADRVDVNVHPQKAEVRFAASREVHELVRDAVASALSEARIVPAYRDLRPAPEALRAVADRPLPSGGSRWVAARQEPSPPPVAPYPTLAAAAAADPVEEVPRVRALAQFRESYIVAEDAEGLLVVDQHAAHERILFERYLTQAEQNRVEIQRLLFARTVELGVAERALLEDEADEFRRLGFLLEPFGGETVRIDGVPAVAAELDPGALLRELLGEAAGVRTAAAAVGALRLRLVTTAACKAAIKIHHALTREGMQRLLDDLFRTDSPTTCPHGRPLVFRLPLGELERAFHRR